MTENLQKKTAPNSSTAIDAEQPFVKNNTNSIQQNSQDCNELQTISMSELFDNIYPPRAYIVENFLYVGTYLFVGSPKVGKSFFMAQLGYTVSSGTELWGYRVNQGEVLYLALEDNYARLQQRLSTMYGTETTPNFHMAILAKKLSDGLDKQLENFMIKNPNTKLIIIDTLKKIRDKETEQYSYSNDYDIVDKLKNFTDKYNICLLIVHHTRKQNSEDAFDTISGSNGLMGAADGAFIMQKLKRVEGKATLDITGRDQQDQKLHLQFNQDNFIWDLIKAENKIITSPPDPLLEKIALILSPLEPNWTGTATELLSVLKDVDLPPNALTRKLNVSVERLLNEYHIRYNFKRTHSGKMIHLTLEVSLYLS
ncbi:MAG: AAA family ATPase [Phocaeicola sp.]